MTPRCTSQLMVVRARLRRLSEDWPKVLGTAAVLGGFDEEGRRADAGGLVRCGVGRQTGRMSFPEVVIDEQIVGGYQELISLTAQHGPAPRRLPRAA